MLGQDVFYVMPDNAGCDIAGKRWPAKIVAINEDGSANLCVFRGITRDGESPVLFVESAVETSRRIPGTWHK